MPSRFNIMIRDNQLVPVSRGDFKDRAYKVGWTTLLPGGCGDLAWRFRHPRRTTPIEIGFNFRVQVSYGGRVVWSGRIEDAFAGTDKDGDYWEVVAKGDGIVVDDQDATTVNVRNTTTSQIVTDVITAINTPNTLIDASSITATGFTISNTADVNLTSMRAADRINWAAEFGDSSNRQQLWYVYPDDNGDRRFTFKPRPTTPDLEGYAKDFEAVRWGFKGRQVYNRVNVDYTGGRSTANDTTLQGAGPDGYGIIRSYTVSVPELTNAGDAAQLAATLLALVKTAKMTAQPMTMKANAVLYNSSGDYVAPWEVRAGQLFYFRDADADDSGPAGTLTFRNSFLIVGTAWDEDGQTLTMTPESYDSELSLMVARSRALLAGLHQV